MASVYVGGMVAFFMIIVICVIVGHRRAFVLCFAEMLVETSGMASQACQGMFHLPCSICSLFVPLLLDRLFVMIEFIYLFSGLLCQNQENLHILLRTNLEVQITSTL